MPETRFDGSFSRPNATATPWESTEEVLREAELYWLTTVRPDGRPHVTPLVGLWLDGAAYFTTGHDEQKARNLAHSPHVALTTGSNSWARGHDVVVEGNAARVTGHDVLTRVARAYVDKYGDDWSFEVVGDEMSEGDHPSGLFRIVPAKVLSFAKDPHAQTSYDF
ncbi:MAG: pyridoxamine 5'-phosphate oxidase family protein [Actinomycetota bacterium]|nr:pyridoxamine 5'-phosphate oxidase family protein [Actinomycetota bacterium]